MADHIAFIALNCVNTSPIRIVTNIENQRTVLNPGKIRLRWRFDMAEREVNANWHNGNDDFNSHTKLTGSRIVFDVQTNTDQRYVKSLDGRVDAAVNIQLFSKVSVRIRCIQIADCQTDVTK